ncbi:hypothetical protein C4571_02715 [Candidatus Parcubacteria bacterium]|nr:MAG: hypothetical protein C4571_02715 [Candidatus Parcubacteria bacterium]
MLFLMKKLFVASVVILPLIAMAQTSPIRDVQGIINLVNSISVWVAAVFWIVAIIAVFYAGFLFLRGGGDEEKLAQAKKQLWYALIAMVIGIMAYGFAPLIRNILETGARGSPSVSPSPTPSTPPPPYDCTDDGTC